MGYYITEFSKYFIALFASFYTYECFAVFRYEKEQDRGSIYVRQYIFMFLVHLSCFLFYLSADRDLCHDRIVSYDLSKCEQTGYK